MASSPNAKAAHLGPDRLRRRHNPAVQLWFGHVQLWVHLGRMDNEARPIAEIVSCLDPRYVKLDPIRRDAISSLEATRHLGYEDAQPTAHGQRVLGSPARGHLGGLQRPRG